MPHTNLQISEKLGAAYQIQGRIHALRHRRINEACRLAGLGDMGCHLHNCLIAHDAGKPWPGIDYSYARKAAWLCKTQFKSSEIIQAFYTRMWTEQRAARREG